MIRIGLPGVWSNGWFDKKLLLCWALLVEASRIEAKKGRAWNS